MTGAPQSRFWFRVHMQFARRQPPRVPLTPSCGTCRRALWEGRLHEHLLAVYPSTWSTCSMSTGTGPRWPCRWWPTDVGDDPRPGSGRGLLTRLGGGCLGCRHAAEHVAGVGGTRLQAQVCLARWPIAAQRALLTSPPEAGREATISPAGDVVGRPQGAWPHRPAGRGRLVWWSRSHDEQTP